MKTRSFPTEEWAGTRGRSEDRTSNSLGVPPWIEVLSVKVQWDDDVILHDVTRLNDNHWL